MIVRWYELAHQRREERMIHLWLTLWLASGRNYLIPSGKVIVSPFNNRILKRAANKTAALWLEGVLCSGSKISVRRDGWKKCISNVIQKSDYQ